MSAPYHLILFDFDGTLVDTIEDIAYYTNQTLEEHGYPRRSTEDVKKAVGWGVHELLKTLAPGFAESTERLGAAVEKFKAAYRSRPIRTTAAYPHVRDMLKGPLRNTFKAIVTNKPQDIAIQILNELELSKYFISVIGMNADFPPKPNPASTLHLMKRWNVTPAKTIYVGDSVIDAETSVAAGIDFAWVNYGYDTVTKSKPAFVFSSAAEWEKLVR